MIHHRSAPRRSENLPHVGGHVRSRKVERDGEQPEGDQRRRDRAFDERFACVEAGPIPGRGSSISSCLGRPCGVRPIGRAATGDDLDGRTAGAARHTGSSALASATADGRRKACCGRARTSRARHRPGAPGVLGRGRPDRAVRRSLRRPVADRRHDLGLAVRAAGRGTHGSHPPLAVRRPRHR